MKGTITPTAAELEYVLALLERELKAPGQKATMGTEERNALVSFAAKLAGLCRTKLRIEEHVPVGRRLSPRPGPRPERAPSREDPLERIETQERPRKDVDTEYDLGPDMSDPTKQDLPSGARK